MIWLKTWQQITHLSNSHIILYQNKFFYQVEDVNGQTFQITTIFQIRLRPIIYCITTYDLIELSNVLTDSHKNCISKYGISKIT